MEDFGMKYPHEERGVYRGTFDRMEAVRGVRDESLVLRDVRDSTGAVVHEILHLNPTPKLRKLGLRRGDVIRFEARIVQSVRGFYPSQVRVD